MLYDVFMSRSKRFSRLSAPAADPEELVIRLAEVPGEVERASEVLNRKQLATVARKLVVHTEKIEIALFGFDQVHRFRRSGQLRW